MTVTATDPEGLSASVTVAVRVIGASQAIFRDDFDDAGSLSNWQAADATAEVTEGNLRLTNTADSVWGRAGHRLDAPLASWEARARMGRARTDSMHTALVFVPANPGQLNFQMFRLEIGSTILRFTDGEEERVDYAFSALYEPQGGDPGWRYFGGDLRGALTAPPPIPASSTG